MAVMIPNVIPTKATPGEKALFKILEGLPEDVIVYYEVSIKHLHPDFIVIDPRLGVLILEVKDWSIDKILEANRKYVLLRTGKDSKSETHPVEQAREYALNLMTTIQSDLEGRILLRRDGDRKGKISFPIGYVAVLSQISREDIDEKNLSTVFDAERTLTSDQLSIMRQLDAPDLEKSLGRYFLPKFRFDVLAKTQVDQLRGIIHPEVVVGSIQQKILEHDEYDFVTQLRVLDAGQENKARRIGPGHRLLFGVAGSGKTTILIARAKLLAIGEADRQGLVICFNRPLKAHIERQLSTFSNLTVQTFHTIARSLGFSEDSWKNPDFAERLDSAISKSDIRYDFILVDEAQDFDRAWFKCVVGLLRKSEDGDLFITGDGSQSIYRSAKFSWKSVGVRATGNRTGYLNIPYRNAINIFRLASRFSGTSTFGELDGIEIALKADPAHSAGGKGNIIAITSKSRSGEIRNAVKIVSGLLAGRWSVNGRERTIHPPLEERDIGIVYPARGEIAELIRGALISKLERISKNSVVWVSDPSRPENRDNMFSDGIRVQTIGHSKGLQYRALIFMFADILPAEDQSRHEQDRQLFYVALTRAGEFLAITRSRDSLFTKEVTDYLKGSKDSASGAH